MKFKVILNGKDEPTAAFTNFYDAHQYCKMVISNNLKPIHVTGSLVWIVYDEEVLAAEYSHNYTHVYFKTPKEVICPL